MLEKQNQAPAVSKDAPGHANVLQDLETTAFIEVLCFYMFSLSSSSKCSSFTFSACLLKVLNFSLVVICIKMKPFIKKKEYLIEYMVMFSY